jgi:hypothetical protein
MSIPMFTTRQQEPVFDPKETKRILRKVDFRLIPVLALLYLLAFLDRELKPMVILSIHTLTFA